MYAQESKDNSKLTFMTNEIYEVLVSTSGKSSHQSALVCWNIDLKEDIIRVRHENEEPISINYKIENFTYFKEESTVIAKIETENYEFTFSIGPGNYYKVKMLDIKDRSPDGAYQLVLGYTNYSVDKVIEILSNQNPN